MAFNLGILGQVLTPALAGGHRGMAMGEAEIYKRRQEEKEAERAARLQALREQLLQSQEARAAEMHPLEMQTERARALRNLPTFAEAPETLGDGLTSMDRLKMEELQSRIGENNAQADWYRRRPATSSGGAGGRAVQPEWEKVLTAIADETRGDLAMMHRKINENPELFQLRANGTIRDYHVGAASSRARKSFRSVNRDEMEGDEPEAGDSEYGQVIPYKFRKFPSEDLRAYLVRLKTQGVDSTTAADYVRAQGLE